MHMEDQESTITSDSIKLSIVSRDGRRELLQARGEEARHIANILDQTLVEPSLQDKLRSTCLVTLRKLCGDCCLLPDSHVISDGLEIVSCSPDAGGGFADVYKGTYGDRVVAIKTLKIMAVESGGLARMRKIFCKEAVGWKYLDHPNVLPFIGASLDASSLSLVSLWMDNGNINDYIERNPEANRLELLVGVSKGVEYLHSVQIVHGDLKGVNILIDAEKNALLADFGLMNVVSDSGATYAETSVLAGGTTRWMSPELLLPEHFQLSTLKATTSSDIYALGMVILEVLTGEWPFVEIRRSQYLTVHVAMMGNRPIRPVDSTELVISDSLWELLQRCWRLESEGRPDVKVVREFLQKAAPTWDPRPHVRKSPRDSRDSHREDTSSMFSTNTVIPFNSKSTPKPDSETLILATGSLKISPALVPGNPGEQNRVVETRKVKKHSSSASFFKKSRLFLQTTSVYHRMRGLKDLDLNIAVQKALLQLRPLDHKDRPSLLVDLGVDLTARYDSKGDLEDLEQAIEVDRECLELSPPTHPERWRPLHCLGIDLRMRFDHKGNLEDLEQAIELHREYLVLRPLEHPDRPRALIELGGDLIRRFDKKGDRKDLEEGIELAQESLALRPPGDPDRWLSLGNLGFGLWVRFDHQGDSRDLDLAIDLHRESLELSPTGNLAHVWALENLGWTIRSRFDQKGDYKDLEEAITLHRECLELCPPGVTFRWMVLRSLGLDLWNRFDLRGDVEDLESAIQLHQDCIALRPIGSDERWVALRNLGADLRSRFELKGDVEDLERAVEMHREHLEFFPPGHAGRWRALYHLGLDFQSRYDHKGDAEYLEHAIAMHSESLTLCPPGNIYRYLVLKDLGLDLGKRFDKKWDVEDLEHAIALCLEAVELCPPNHYRRQRTSEVLESLLLKRV